jgi:hypothetical protein
LAAKAETFLERFFKSPMLFFLFLFVRCYFRSSLIAENEISFKYAYKPFPLFPAAFGTLTPGLPDGIFSDQKS